MTILGKPWGLHLKAGSLESDGSSGEGFSVRLRAGKFGAIRALPAGVSGGALALMLRSPPRGARRSQIPDRSCESKGVVSGTAGATLLLPACRCPAGACENAAIE